jgi:hypothetical protein
MNLPPLTHRPRLSVRLRPGCPLCDGLHVSGSPPASVHREYDWYECDDCDYRWALPHIPTRPANKWDAR